MKPYLIAALLVGSAVAQTTKPTPTPKPIESWSVCLCDGKKQCIPPIDNMVGGTEAACKKVGGVWHAVTATMQGIMTPEQQAASPENAWMKPCGKDNHDDWCVEAKTPTPAPKDDPYYCPNCFIWVNPEQPKPFDVPPISEEYGKPGISWCDMGQCTFVEGADPFGKDHGIRRTRLTCADKTRFLMAAEDGSKHCLALSPTPTQKEKP